ncbi:MAG: prolyl oligopeptidase family serine peptidase [Calditrichia bacterium]
MQAVFSIHRIVILLLLFMLTQLLAQEKEQSPMALNSWLITESAPIPVPAFQEDPAEIKELLNSGALDWQSLQPKSGATLSWNGNNESSWRVQNAETLTFASSKSALPQQALAACYVQVEKFTKLKVTLESAHLLQLFLNGSSVATKESSESEDESGKLTHTLSLETGKHVLIIRTLRDPANSKAWSIKTTVDHSDVTVSLSPETPFNIQQLLSSPLISGISISPDGSTAAVNLRQVIGDEKRESWLELRSTKTGRLLNSYRGFASLGGINWAPIGKRFIYTSRSDGKATVWLVDLSKGSSRALMRDVEHFRSYSWSPDGSYIIYSITQKAKKDDRGVHKLSTPRDRWPNFQDRNFLYKLDIASGQKQQLTSGKHSTNLYAIHPQKQTLLIGQTTDDFANRPYTKTTLKLLTLADLSVEEIVDVRWMNQASWSPDGKKLVLTGGPNLFGDIGVNVREGQIPNDYDTQAYLYDLNKKKATALTRTFNPSLNSVRWKDNNSLLMSVTEGEYAPIYSYNLARKSFKKLKTGVDVVSSFDVSTDGKMIALYGSGVTSPPKAFVVDTKKNQPKLLSFPARQQFTNTRFGNIKDWSFKNSRGDNIEGRVYYPPNFDPAKKYPAIVYYYGGTVPVSRSFGGRYPYNLFAANGYVVYVLQPSGAIGYGQSFSAYHVNDWGKIVADEIISGTKAFLAEHSFVDRKRVGCMGASYGGFMTMLLTTRTDIFAGAISHAGISSLSSYWGEGFWGYLYSAVATANSFPWNRPDLYVDQSPLFQADKVTTPLLLLTGDSDTNVPRGESDQFYVALKVLEKEVDYIRIEGQDHHILDHKKRMIWQRTIIAWFDRYLKGDANWWDSLYPAE